MATVKQCDRCEELYPLIEKESFEPGNKYVSFPGAFSEVTLDLCDSCFKSFEQWRDLKGKH